MRTLINKKIVEDLINHKKIAIIYISELSNSFPPFWLSKTTTTNVFTVSQENITKQFDEINKIVDNLNNEIKNKTLNIENLNNKI